MRGPASYRLSDPLQLRQLLADANSLLCDWEAVVNDRPEKFYEFDEIPNFAALRTGLATLLASLEAGPTELVIYSDAEKRLRLRLKRKGAKSSEGSSIEARFEKFHEANPHVYEAIVRRLRALADQGVTRTSVKTAIENLRWSPTGVRRNDTEKAFKISNDFASRYARLISANEPELGGMLAMKVLKAI